MDGQMDGQTQTDDLSVDESDRRLISECSADYQRSLPPPFVPDSCKHSANLISSTNIWPRDLDTANPALGRYLLPMRFLREIHGRRAVVLLTS